MLLLLDGLEGRSVGGARRRFREPRTRCRGGGIGAGGAGKRDGLVNTVSHVVLFLLWCTPSYRRKANSGTQHTKLVREAVPLLRRRETLADEEETTPGLLRRPRLLRVVRGVGACAGIVSAGFLVCLWEEELGMRARKVGKKR